MAITEESRHRLYKALEESIGAQNANILMEHLPPVGWADLATKRDLEHLAAATRQDLERQELRLEASLHRELRHQTNVFVTWMIASNAAMASAILAGLKLF